MRIVYFVNAAWYFELHWLDRSEAAISKGYEVHLVSNFADDAIKNNLEKKGIKCWDIELNRFSKNVFKNISIFTAFRGNDSNLLIVFYVQIMPDDLVMQLHRF